jgi:hypothetical protein
MLPINDNHLQAYGLKFIINVEGLARKFSLKNTVLNVGNGLALLGITTLICEFVLTYFIKVSNSFKHREHLVFRAKHVYWCCPWALHAECSGRCSLPNMRHSSNIPLIRENDKVCMHVDIGIKDPISVSRKLLQKQKGIAQKSISL